LRYFVLTNDPDHGKTEDYKLILRELSKNNIFVTTAVFCTLKDDKSALAKHCHRGDTDTLDVKEYRFFSDHYYFKRKDIEEFRDKIVVTTKKDYVKLRQFGLKLKVIEMDLEINQNILNKIERYLLKFHKI
jgi:hypothetical protein